MLILFSLHFFKDLSGRGIIGFQSGGEVGLDTRIRFFGRNCQRQDFLFRKVFEIFWPRYFLRLSPNAKLHLNGCMRNARAKRREGILREQISAIARVGDFSVPLAR
jgi:hypothetical protein